MINTSGEFHFPGDNFLGPGTDIVNRVMQGIKPKSFADSTARDHDIDYLISSGSSLGAIRDDYKAILSNWSNLDLDALALKLGLMLRTTGNVLTFGQLFNYNHPLPGKTPEQTALIGKMLKDKVDYEKTHTPIIEPIKFVGRSPYLVQQPQLLPSIGHRPSVLDFAQTTNIP